MTRARIPLPVLSQAPPLVECTECARCCTYVAVGINAPTTPRLATDVLWYLYHESVYVYRDDDGEWSVVFETRCRNLGVDRRCGVYAERPHICRGFDNRSCEVNAPSEKALTFREPAEFLDWLQKARPRLHERIEAGFVPKPPQASPQVQSARARRAVARHSRT
jgi:Fe-S-cluster containining protein